MIVEGLLLLTPLVPATLAALWVFPPLRPAATALAPWSAAPAVLLAVHPGALGVPVRLPGVFTGLELTLDPTGRVFLLFTAALWLLAGAYARSYHRADPAKDRFFGFFALTMAGNLGLVIAADVLTAYLFFALMTFAAYGLVAHRRDEEAIRAGRIYIAMAVLGELFILSALFSLGDAAGGPPRFGSELEDAWRVLILEGTASRVGLLLIAGFGIKAGLAPLHLWLPLAHPVAPTAASALLSGAMIKAGLLAWIRSLPAELVLLDVGAVLMAGGLATAFYGAVAGLPQDASKTVLAYSSVSQMGFMALGVGLLVRTPGAAPAALVAVLLFATHHALAKGALFLSVGVGGRWAVAGAAVPAAAVAGLPLSSGARAKAALSDAVHELAPAWYPAVGPLLLAAATGTALLMARFLVTLHREKIEEGGRSAGTGGQRASLGLLLPWAFLILLSATLHLGHPAWFPLRDEVGVPPLLDHLGDAALPVVVGVVAAGLVWKSPAVLGPLRGVRIPPGDVIVPLERAARRLGALPGRDLPDRLVRKLLRLRVAQVWTHARAAWAAERDLLLLRGPVLAFILLALTLLLFLTLPLR